MIDLQEAAACLDEHRILLAATSGMLKPDVAEGEAGQAIGNFNDRLIETLNSQLQDAVILSILVCEEMKETPERLVDFPGELADFFVVLNQLRLGINKAAEAVAEFHQAAAEAKAKAVKDNSNSTAAAVDAFRRRTGLKSKEEIEEYERERDIGQKSQPDPVETLNTPNPIEICVAAETDASGNEAGTEIRIEPLESPSAENPGEECGARADTMDNTETILNWLVNLDRTSLLAVLSNEAEAAQLLVRSARQRTASQRAKHREAIDYVDRVNRILSFFRDGSIAPGMSEHELSLCQSFEEKMLVRGPS
jgi:hypothetical protein